MEDVLQLFEARSTSGGFKKSWGTTPVQKAWPFIAEEKTCIRSAPTGTGKTLSAFLVFIDRWEAGKGRHVETGIKLIYVSPLKSWRRDIRET